MQYDENEQAMALRFKWLFFLIFLYPFCTLMGLPTFNFEQTNQQLDTIVSEFDTIDKNAKQLSADVRQINQIIEMSKACVSDSKQMLTRINEVVDFFPKKAVAEQADQSYVYLQNQKEEYQNALAECKLTEFRAQEVLKQVQTKLHVLSTSKILEKRTYFFSHLKELNLTSIPQQFSAALAEKFVINNITHAYLAVFLFIVLFNIFSLTLFSCKNIYHYVPMMISFGLLAAYNFYWRDAYHLNVLDAVVYTAFVYAATQTLTRVSYVILDGLYRHADEHQQLEFEFKSNHYARVVSILFLIYYLFYLNDAVNGLKDLVHLFVFTIFAIMSAQLFWPKAKGRQKKIKHIKIAWILLCIAAFETLEFMGFHQLNEFLLLILVTTLLVVILMKSLLMLVYWIIALQTKLVQSISVHQEIYEMKFPELSMTKYSMYTIVLAMAGLVLCRVWQIPPNIVSSIENTIIHGFAIYNITVIPLRLVLAVLSFSILQYVVKFTLCAIYLRKTSDDEDDDIADIKHNVTMFSIFYYIGMIVNILIALVISGINFTSLAIIAGALSVGIGLGLQGIVNNFISGIILLVEKPIKPGDRISIDGKEGFVKKVNFRATQVTTIFKEDLIVPNYELISKTVTNFVFKNSQASIACDVRVAYQSNTDLVTQTLLDVALAHPEVSRAKKNYPTIFFKSFGESALEFCLWVTILDVNKKYKVNSELNYAINKAFKDKGITIAYPQLDVHMDSVKN